MGASFHFLVIGLSSHVLCVDGELGRDEMADREDEMNLLLRVVVFGIRAEIWGFGDQLSGKRAHTIPPGTDDDFKGGPSPWQPYPTQQACQTQLTK